MGDGGALFTLFGTVAGTVLLLRAVWVYQKYVEQKLIERGSLLEKDLADRERKLRERDEHIDALVTVVETKDRHLRDLADRNHELTYDLARAYRRLDELGGDEPRLTRTRITDPPPPLEDT